MCSPSKELLKSKDSNSNNNTVSNNNDTKVMPHPEPQPLPETETQPMKKLPKQYSSITASSSTSSSASSSGCSSPSSPSTSSASVLATTNYPLIPRERLEVQEQLGAGTYGSVFRGCWTRTEGDDGQQTQVAMKKVFMLDKEVEILSQIRHRNIIQFYGVSNANPDYWIVMEYAENGSLFDQLHNNNAQTPLSIERLIRWAVQIARGVVYLHHEAPLTVIHRDLKSKNIVIGRKNQCKLCDFGTSKDLTHSWTVPSWGGTAAWMSPEIISQRPEGITTATDVWSYAVVLWELFSHEIPYNGLTEFKIYSIISQHGVRLVIPDTCPVPLAELLRSCWQTEPKERPDIKYVLAILEQMGSDCELQREVTQFLAQRKEEWREQIRDQLTELEELKLDLARQMEDLRRREAIVRRRENSHRNFLHAVDTLNVEDVCEWNEDCVCEWVQNIAASAMEDFSECCVDLLVSCILQYDINGPRLLRITESDLECLGIEPVAVRRYIGMKLDELRAMNVQLCNYNGCCSTAIDQQQQQHVTTPPVEQPILLHVGLYSRTVSQPGGRGPAYRFKVFLDSDWEVRPSTAAMAPGEMPELPDSSFLIKEVSIAITGVDHTPLLEPVQCICPPFGYLEWLQLDAAEQRRKLPLTVTISVTYTDQVVQPRNTRIQIQLDTLSSGPRTLCNKRVALRIARAEGPSSVCLSRISSQMLMLKSPPPSMHALRCRRRSAALISGTSSATGSNSPDNNNSGRAPSSTNLLNRSPIWADLAATIRNPSGSAGYCITGMRPVSKSISLDVAPSTSKAIMESAAGDEHLQRSVSDGNNEKDADVNKIKQDDAKGAAADDPIQRARQAALARVRNNQQQQNHRQRKKCASETETTTIDSKQRQSADEQQHMAKFYLSQPSTSSSLSHSPFSMMAISSRNASAAANKASGSGGSTADSEGSPQESGREAERCHRTTGGAATPWCPVKLQRDRRLSHRNSSPASHQQQQQVEAVQPVDEHGKMKRR